jgi:hypothetical protein
VFSSLGRFVKRLFKMDRDKIQPEAAPLRKIEVKPTPTFEKKPKKENVSRHQWAHGNVIKYSDRSYYVDHDGRFLRLKPGESVDSRIYRLANNG